jgi:myxalamid-type polyketide synthase MxaE and MxaD
MELARVLEDIAPGAASIRIVSTLTGQITDGAQFNAGYWARQMREPVQFYVAMKNLIASGNDVFIEIGPHPVLAPAIAQCLSGAAKEGHILPSMRRDRGGHSVMLESLASLYGLSCPVLWERIYTSGRCVNLPPYPWQHKRYWLDAAVVQRRSSPAHPLLGNPLPELAHSPGARVWESALSKTELPFLWEHRIQGVSLIPAAAFVELILAAGGEERTSIRNVAFQQKCALTEDGSRVLQVTITPESAIRIHSRVTDGAWTLHATATFDGKVDGARNGADVNEIRNRCSASVSGEVYYRKFVRLDSTTVALFKPSSICGAVKAKHWHKSTLRRK